MRLEHFKNSWQYSETMWLNIQSRDYEEGHTFYLFRYEHFLVLYNIITNCLEMPLSLTFFLMRFFPIQLS